MAKRFISLLLVVLLCVALPVSVMASEGEQSASKSGFTAFEGEEYTEVTAPALYEEAPLEEELPQTFEGEPVEAPVLYENDQTGMGTGTLVAIIAAAVVVVAAVVFFLLRKKK